MYKSNNSFVLCIFRLQYSLKESFFYNKKDGGATMYLLGVIAFISSFFMIGLFSYLFAEKPELATEDLTEEQQQLLLEEKEERMRLLWRTGYIAIAVFVCAIAGIFAKSLLLYYT